MTLFDGLPQRRHTALRRWYRAIIVIASFAWLSMNPALAQILGKEESDGISTWRVVGALILCLVLGTIAAFALKFGASPRLFLSRKTDRRRKLALVESLRLSHQTDLCIVDCEGHRVLLAISAHGAQLLHHLPQAADGGAARNDGQS